MRTIVKIDVYKEDKIITKPFDIDDTICDGIYYTVDDKKVKDNIKRFRIKKSPAKTHDDIGISYSKIGKCVIVTFNIRQPSFNLYGQFVVGDEVTPFDILNSEHPALKGFKPVLMDACDLAKVETLEDLRKLERLV